MLTQYEKYNRIWSLNLQRQIKVRDKLEGKVNEVQQEKDKAIWEKIDSDYKNLKEARNTLSQAFDNETSETVRVDNWISNLRQSEVGIGQNNRVICCHKREEDGHDATLAQNKRSLQAEVMPEKIKHKWSSGRPLSHMNFTKGQNTKNYQTEGVEKKDKNNKVVPKRFIKECENSTSRSLSHRYVWTKSTCNRTISDMGCVGKKDDIPVFKSCDSTKYQQIYVKPSLTATKRPLTSRVGNPGSHRTVSLSGLRITNPTVPQTPGRVYTFSGEGDMTNQNVETKGQVQDKIEDYSDVKKLDPDTVSTTDFQLYNRAAGYRSRKSQIELTVEEKKRIEKALPCPHDPSALSGLFLQGRNKLQMEEEVARKSHRLVNLNGDYPVHSSSRRNHADLCLIETGEHERTKVSPEVTAEVRIR